MARPSGETEADRGKMFMQGAFLLLVNLPVSEGRPLILEPGGASLFELRTAAGYRKKPNKVQNDQAHEPGKANQKSKTPKNVGSSENLDVFDKDDLAGACAAVCARGARMPTDFRRRIPVASGTNLAGPDVHQLALDLDLVSIHQKSDDPLKLPAIHQ